MDIIQIVFLSLVQGFTEFLPISSSAHLILVPKFLGWSDQGLAFDVALHVGTLIAVLYYFKSDIFCILKDFLESFKKREKVGESTLGWAVIVGTIPVGLAGISFNDFISNNLRSPEVIAATTLIFGLALFFSDRNVGKKSEINITIKVAILIGIAQAIALIPGTSRSGITMTAALFLGFSRVASARFSFLLSIPVIILAGGLKTLELIESKAVVVWSELFFGIGLSALSAYACIYFFLKLISKTSMLPFVIYRFILGIFLLSVF
ncbi:undecaprenyl-diphosphate phosphatase [Sulfurospirillum arcachonense]|uniref:undecaprenyl-diphosphate phosphatase n=1 Tax=Sulfurospirillum arcachonense TaxID=57666 RepID=UPI0004683691|nr:undecaprenyl-diphosphate phosphatase [Sulfurospirillum arcachonense]